MVSRVLFINDSTPFGNWGGRGATTALRTMTEAAGGEIVHTLYIDDLESAQLDGPAPIAPPAAPNPTREKIKQFVPPAAIQARRRLVDSRRPPEGPPVIPQVWEEFEPAARRVTEAGGPWPRLLRMLRDVDVAVIFGDGDIYGNHQLPRTLLFLSYVLKRKLDIPVVMVAHSADLEHPNLRRIAEHVYPLYDDVVFRDRISQERCREICDGRFAPDPAFLYGPAPRDAWASLAGRPSYLDVWPDHAAFDPAQPYICIGGSSYFDAVDVEQVSREYAQLIERLQAADVGQVVLTASDNVDNAIFRPLARSQGLPLVGVATPVQQAVDIVGNADAYIGGRFHAAVFALRGGVPVVPISAKTFKMQALAELAGLPPAPFTATRLGREADGVVSALLELLGQGPALKERLAAWGDKMARDCLENAGYVRRQVTADVEPR
jgi:polysaccharide pyruvyl transferase WcaK-like protein